MEVCKSCGVSSPWPGGRKEFKSRAMKEGMFTTLFWCLSSGDLQVKIFRKKRRHFKYIFFYFFAGQVPFVHSQVPLGAAEVPRGEPRIFRLNDGTSIWRI